MQEVPIRAVPNQALSVILGAQNCQINIYQKRTGLFVDVYVNNTLIVAGVLAQHLRRIVRENYRGFIGDLVFYDTQGADDPTYTGLGMRWSLIYLEAGETPTSRFAP